MNHTDQKFSLGSLTDLRAFNDAVDVRGVSVDQLLAMLHSMWRIRKAEQRIAEGRRDGLIGGPVHLGIGQEAVAVGVSVHLRPSDRVFGAHRSHSHLLALGSSVQKLFAEVLGKETGHCKGNGGSMHLWDQPHGFYGSAPIVAGVVPLAVGAALAANMRGTDDVSVVYLGDGATEEGVVHESLNLARMLKAPVLFVVENNLFASHMHISLRQPSDCTARFAAANDIPYTVVDGNDTIAVRKASADLISSLRSGKGPGYLEAVTYRWFGHVDWREDIDVGVSRSAIDLAAWRERDPIARLVAGMIAANMCSTAEVAEMEASVQRQIDEAWSEAMKAPYPGTDALFVGVYAPTGDREV
ncbi:MAG: thiamine pyrophosphate-dependent dehydrogenase E1 component subunit alpha [Magnetococcales bacterium]|nr:thiamine pyrophosphate-dependent dehydrogenase E1 component subunit alpha [Magnetococcales bacterium]NGZ25592.1 thiamine pyrophosphate-dependent dehydrogenase E1 component subunit alpha [Magnetococcales bacterium]